jgi:hypothetical protein
VNVKKMLMTSLQIGTFLSASFAAQALAGINDSECQSRYRDKCHRDFNTCMDGCDPNEYDFDYDDAGNHVETACGRCYRQRRDCLDAAGNQTAEEREVYNGADDYSYTEEWADMCRDVSIHRYYTEHQEYCFDGPVGGCWSVDVWETYHGEWYQCPWAS